MSNATEPPVTQPVEEEPQTNLDADGQEDDGKKEDPTDKEVYKIRLRHVRRTLLGYKFEVKCSIDEQGSLMVERQNPEM